jgi:hypothetical protein
MKKKFLRHFDDICEDNKRTGERRYGGFPHAVYHRDFDRSLTVIKSNLKYFGNTVYVRLDKEYTGSTGNLRKIYTVYDINKARIYDLHVYDCWLMDIDHLPDELFDI